MGKRIDRIIRVIELLADGKFHSGEVIGREIGVTRTAISEYIKDIQKLGLDVFRVTGKGYRLHAPLQLIDTNIAHDLVCERVVTSTNDLIRERLRDKSELPAGYAIVAEAQTAGRGRRGKNWFSPFGSNLYISLYWPLERGMTAAMGLSVAIGTVIAEVLQSYGVANTAVKWPNDVLASGRKLAGVLIELEGNAVESAHAVIGVGINVDMPKHMQAPIEQPWTDLSTELEQRVDRNALVKDLVVAFREGLAVFEREGLAAFLSRWQQFDQLVGREVTILVGDKKIRGTAVGIANDGGLNVEVEGVVQKYHAGEVSLRDANV
ncbi:bifunctional biotin--[acetyl-CoA-carboxylase] ligase/biotin operon repressor BirA [Pseudidiomarina salilacus]|uniref:bifunctional biotin--[acetyl-CoA-carboxylase] ligase/biotin operon repressor BirA n=1 Tax=Pseudidiomarina salilacus TaxID=3384452 RepID=UPI003984B0DC